MEWSSHYGWNLTVLGYFNPLVAVSGVIYKEMKERIDVQIDRWIDEYVLQSVQMSFFFSFSFSPKRMDGKYRINDGFRVPVFDGLGKASCIYCTTTLVVVG